MNTETLRTFLLLVKLKQFTRVAEQLFVSQSTVTNRIAELERELGVRLFTREMRTVALTKEGKTVYEYARRMVEMEDGCRNALQNSVHQVRMGATNAVYEGALKERVLQGVAAGGAYRVTLGHTAELLEMLWDGLLDVAYVYQNVKRSGYLCTPFSEDELVLLVRQDKNRCANGITRDRLATLPCAMCNFSLAEIGSYLRELFPAGHVFPFEVDNSNKIKDFLAAGLGYAFLPRGIVKAELESGLLVEVTPLNFDRMKIYSYRVCRIEQSERCI